MLREACIVLAVLCVLVVPTGAAEGPLICDKGIGPGACGSNNGCDPLDPWHFGSECIVDCDDLTQCGGLPSSDDLHERVSRVLETWLRIKSCAYGGDSCPVDAPVLP